jgi:hypothetical protein
LGFDARRVLISSLPIVENAGPIWPHLGGFRWSDLAPP